MTRILVPIVITDLNARLPKRSRKLQEKPPEQLAIWKRFSEREREKGGSCQSCSPAVGLYGYQPSTHERLLVRVTDGSEGERDLRGIRFYEAVDGHRYPE